jgi:hypothetical protein
MQMIPITTDVVGSTPARGKVYNIMWVTQFINDLWQVGGFLRVLRFPPPIKLNATI